MLELRPCCEHCAKELPPESDEAMICSFECTFCSDCVGQLDNVCPNCGGGFSPRPVRPATNWRNDNFLGRCPPTSKVTFKPVDFEEHAKLRQAVAGRSPQAR